MHHPTVTAARRKLERLRAYHEEWTPTTLEQPLHDNMCGAVKVTRERQIRVPRTR